MTCKVAADTALTLRMHSSICAATGPASDAGPDELRVASRRPRLTSGSVDMLAQIIHELASISLLTIERTSRRLHEAHLRALVSGVQLGDVL